jgi:hypothetical protein
MKINAHAKHTIRTKSLALYFPVDIKFIRYMSILYPKKLF